MRYFTIILALTLAILLFGCVGNTQSFYLDQPFQVKEGVTYYNQAQDLTLKVISFTDSRCPQGVECIWAGELGVNLQVNDSNVYLGTITKKSASINTKGKTINLTLGSIDTNQAEITLTKN